MYRFLKPIDFVIYNKPKPYYVGWRLRLWRFSIVWNVQYNYRSLNFEFTGNTMKHLKPVFGTGEELEKHKSDLEYAEKLKERVSNGN